MQNIGFRYTQFINRKYQRTGHLFQGRFKAFLVKNSASLSLIELVGFFKRDLSGLSQGARRIERRFETDGLLGAKVAGVVERLRISVCQA